MTEHDFVRSLQKGLSILEAFTPARPRLRFQEIVEIVGMPKSTIARFLQTLIALNYIAHDPETKYYYLCPQVLSLGYTALSSMDLKEIADPYILELSRVSGQNVNLAVLNGTDIIIVERIQRRQILAVNIRVGSKTNLYRSALGKAILAFLDEEKLRRVLHEILQKDEARKFIGNDGERLVLSLEEVRQRGYALNDEDFIKGLRAIAAPIFNGKGHVEGAINIPVFAPEVSRKKLIEHYVPMLLTTVDRISAANGYKKTMPITRHT